MSQHDDLLYQLWTDLDHEKEVQSEHLPSDQPWPDYDRGFYDGIAHARDYIRRLYEQGGG